MDHHEILRCIKASSFNALVGLREGDFFEAKGPHPYDLAGPIGRYELAKDVSAFANAEGGIIVVGLTHAPVSLEDTEEVSAILPIGQAEYSVSQIRGIVRTHVYPNPTDIDVNWVPSNMDPNKGLGYIFVPAQTDEHKFFIVTKVVEDGVTLRENVFGIFRRVRAHNVPLQPHEMARYIKDGRSPIAQRLTRIESKLDAILEEPSSSESPAKKLDERLREI